MIELKDFNYKGYVKNRENKVVPVALTAFKANEADKNRPAFIILEVDGKVIDQTNMRNVRDFFERLEVPNKLIPEAFRDSMKYINISDEVLSLPLINEATAGMEVLPKAEQAIKDHERTIKELKAQLESSEAINSVLKASLADKESKIVALEAKLADKGSTDPIMVNTVTKPTVNISKPENKQTNKKK